MLNVTEDNLNGVLDSLNHNFIRLDTYTRELDDYMREKQFAEHPMDPHVVQLSSMILEFKEILDTQQSLWYYIKEIVEDDAKLVHQLKDRINTLEQ